MADLTNAQLAVLRAAAKGENAWTAARDAYLEERRRKRNTAGRSATTTVNGLGRRGLIDFDHGYIPAKAVLTDTGRAALALAEEDSRG